MVETPQGVPESIVFTHFDGLKNTIDRNSLGPTDLVEAMNIDLDDAGKPHRRRGRTQVASGSFHSGWNAQDGTAYGVKNGDLGIIESDYYFSVLQAGVGGGGLEGNLNYEQIGDNIYFTSAYSSGIIAHKTGVVSEWGPSQDFLFSPVVDPSPTLPAISPKIYGGPPRATALAYYNGRIYLARKRMLWATILYLYSLVDKTRGFIQFEDDITMVAAVADGLYVGTTEGLWFLHGGSFETLQRTRVMDSAVIPGSMVYIPAELANPPQVGPGVDSPVQVSIAFMTVRGFCVGEDGGKCTNFTEGKYFFPQAPQSAAFWRRQDGLNQYVLSLQSTADPVNGARIGKYVDPAIRRGNAHWLDVADSANATEQWS